MRHVRTIHLLRDAVVIGLLTIASWSASPVVAQEVRTVVGGGTVVIGDISNILIRVPKPVGSLVVMTGGSGMLKVGPAATIGENVDNVLIRNRDAFARAGFNVLLVEKDADLAAAVRYMAKLKRPVTVVATSAGTPRAAQGIRAGARPDRLVLTSGFLTPQSGPGDSVTAILGRPDHLPPTLIVHHRDDHCRFTSPAGVAPFQRWAGRRVRVAWLTGGTEADHPCRYDAHHGFAGQDAALVEAVTGFAG